MHFVAMFSSIYICSAFKTNTNIVFTVPFSTQHRHLVLILFSTRHNSWSPNYRKCSCLNRYNQASTCLTIIKQDQKWYCAERELWLAKNSFFSFAVVFFHRNVLIVYCTKTTDSVNTISCKKSKAMRNTQCQIIPAQIELWVFKVPWRISVYWFIL